MIPEAKTNPNHKFRENDTSTRRRRHKPTPLVDGMVLWWIVRPMAVAKRARKSLGDPEGCETVTPQSRRCFDPKFFQFSGIGTGTVNTKMLQG